SPKYEPSIPNPGSRSGEGILCGSPDFGSPRRMGATADIMKNPAALLMQKAFLIFAASLLLLAVCTVPIARTQPREASRVQFNDILAKSGITFHHERGA